jgi:hypothetical protein
MSTTRIADILEPSVWLNYWQYERPEKNALVRSGILAAPPAEVTSQLNAGGFTIDMPFWNDLTRGEADVISDDESQESTPDKIGTSKDQAVKQALHKSWSNMDLAGMVATGDRNDPVKVVMARMSEWWTYEEQQRIIKTASGILADNVANDSGDMVYDVYSDISSPLAANKFSHAAFTRARLTMGDMLDDLSVVAVHSKVYGDMLDNDAIDFVKESELNKMIPYYQGHMVIVDDGLLVVSGVNTPKYVSYLFGQGAFAYADKALDPEYAMERDRNPAAGNGGGQTVIHTRREFLLHMRGVKFTKSVMAGKSPTWAELANASNYDRVYDRKKIRFAALYTN